MPIKINLLAEQQYAEEMRRKDPVKKALLVAGGLVALMMVWIFFGYLDLRNAHKELEGHRLRWSQNTNAAINASNVFKSHRDLEFKLASLQKYASNRFLWANALDAIQHTVVTNIKVLKLVSVQTYVTNAVIKKTSNVVLTLTPPRKWYQFGKGPAPTNVLFQVTNYMNAMTNLTLFVTTRTEVIRKYSLKTNDAKTEVTAAIDAIKPLTTTETRILVINGKDYSTTPGQQIFSLTNSLMTSPFFSKYFGITNVSIDSSFQLESDPVDRSQGEYVLFNVYGYFPEVIRSNE